MPLRKLKQLLDSTGTPYRTINHPTAYTTQEIAKICHVPGKNMAKTVMVNLDGKLAMAVLPAIYHVDFFRLQDMAHANVITLAKEDDFEDVFPDCELGAMPPFGNLYDMSVFAAKKLAEDKEICFNAGSHTELISMTWNDYEKLVHPTVGEFAREW